MEQKPIAILGAGAWGTALALHLARMHQTVFLWSAFKEEITALKTDKANQRFLPGYPFPATIQPTEDIAAAIDAVEDILIVIPSVAFRKTLQLLQPHLQTKHRIICATKGIDATSGNFLNEVTWEILGRHIPFAVLSGPSFAKEVASGLPTAVVLASHDKSFLQKLQRRFTNNVFRTVLSKDVIGVELGGVGKNIIALAVGIVDGMTLGANARSALLTYGFQEMQLLCVALGGNLATLTGLSGFGDLILTSLDDLSRNRRFGKALGEGISVKEAEEKIGQAVEGKQNVDFLVQLAQQHNIEMPVSTMVQTILRGNSSAHDAFDHWFATIA